MAIPSSGAISMSMFNTELGRTSNTANSKLAGGSTVTADSLFGIAATLGTINTTAPHAMSEWYGYSALSPLVLYNFAGGQSWSGSGTNVVNFGSGGSTYNGTTAGSPAYVSGDCGAQGCGAFDSQASGYITIPGTSTLYSSNFTWFMYHYMEAIPSSDLAGIFWSESGTKNFLWGYRSVGNYTSPNNPAYARIDTPSSVYQSPVAGTQYNGLGGCCSAYFQPYHQTIATILVKNGTSFTQYYFPYGGSLTKLWEITISDWSIGNTSQAIAAGARNDGSFPNDQYLYGLEMYTQALTEGQMDDVALNFLNGIYGYCC